jgi:hypothetical protein
MAEFGIQFPGLTLVYDGAGRTISQEVGFYRWTEKGPQQALAYRLGLTARMLEEGKITGTDAIERVLRASAGFYHFNNVAGEHRPVIDVQACEMKTEAPPHHVSEDEDTEERGL